MQGGFGRVCVHLLSIISRFGTQLGCLLLLVSVAKVFRRLSTTRSAPDMRQLTHYTDHYTVSCVFRSLLFSSSSQRYRSTSESLYVLSSHKPNKEPLQALHPLPSNPKPATPPPPKSLGGTPKHRLRMWSFPNAWAFMCVVAAGTSSSKVPACGFGAEGFAGPRSYRRILDLRVIRL